MKKTRMINASIAALVWAALAANAACECTGWSLAGDMIGWALIVGTLALVVDNKIKERAQQ